jgi:hypothetical protein
MRAKENQRFPGLLISLLCPELDLAGGLDAAAFLGFLASLFDFCCPLAMIFPLYVFKITVGAYSNDVTLCLPVRNHRL